MANDWPTIEAVVPGNVELDLMRAGELPDITVGNNIYALRKYEAYQWWYRRSFATPAREAGQRVELVFEGIDCIADVFVNGARAGHADNMFIAHRFDVTDYLRRDASNDLAVRIDSAVLEGRKHRPAPREHASRGNWESLSIRKAPHGYGWDIMPRVVSAGLWRGVYLEVVNPTRWSSVYWATQRIDAARRTARVLCDWDFATDRCSVDDLRVRIALRRNGQTAFEREYPVVGTHGRAWIDLKGADLWWPRGMGEAALYDATIELLDPAGTVLDVHSNRLGVRTIELRRTDITEPDNPGEFVFVVNHEKVFVKGTNWVPLDALHSRDAQHLAAAFDMIVDLNCNMIRCWGGNVYEDHAFFDLCDANGVMVWQDFAMACAIYPETGDFLRAIRLEAEAVVTKLRNHASLTLWSGNNEIDEAFQWCGIGLDPNTDRISREVLPEVARRLDPFRPYLPSSPYRGPELIRRHGEKRLEPETHLWGPRTDFKGAFYTESLAHFVSETGYHGCPDPRSLRQMMDPEFVWPWQDNDQWLTKAVRPQPTDTNYNYRIPLMATQIQYLFQTVPDNLDDYARASQISQAEALKFFIERMRAGERRRTGKWRRTGILWWNLRDGWPIISDAIVDYYNRKKLAYGYVRRVQTDVCVICGEATEGAHPIIVVNDTRQPVHGRLKVSDADTGRTLLETDFAVEPNGTAKAGAVAQATSPAMWLLDWTLDGGASGANHYLAGPRPFSLRDYRRWLGKLSLRPDQGPFSS